MLKQIFWVAAGGSLGATLRYLLTIAINISFLSQFHYATLSINTLGSLLMGALFGLTQQYALADGWRLFLMVGVLGSFTTFSTFSLDAFQLLHTQFLKGLLYIISMLMLNILAISIGCILIKN